MPFPLTTYRKSAPAAAAPVLRKLRVKFVALNMTIAALVLAGSFSAICFADYRSDVDELHRTLAQSVRVSLKNPRLTPEPLAGPDTQEAEGEGTHEFGVPGAAEGTAPDGTEAPAETVPPSGEDGAGVAEGNDPQTSPSPTAPSIGAFEEEDGQAEPSADAADAGAAPTDAEGTWAPPQIGGDGERSVPIASYYVSGNVVMQLAARSTATVPESLLLSALPAVAQSSADWGYLADADLYFAKREAGPDLIVSFADGAAADGWQSLAVTLAVGGVGALAVLFLLNLAFSRWALTPVQQAWTQQQQFVADASHELKTPLTVILANNAILREHGADTVASQSQWLESTQVEAERMQGLVTDMLDLARAGALGASPARDELDFSRLVEGEVLTFESVAFERGIQWESTVEEGVRVRGDSRRLQRLVGILLDNACKYTEPGGRVAVALRTEERAAVLSVRNSGEPIAPADLAHLFDRFYRVDKARTHDAPAGYGLGLSIAQDIAQAHKAPLTVRSNAAEGTVFTLRLPLN